jgi:hypothetical protein
VGKKNLTHFFVGRLILLITDPHTNSVELNLYSSPRCPPRVRAPSRVERKRLAQALRVKLESLLSDLDSIQSPKLVGAANTDSINAHFQTEKHCQVVYG